MSNDIFTQFTKEQNKTTGRRGYCMWKREKESVITPSDYGMFLETRKNRGKRKGK